MWKLVGFAVLLGAMAGCSSPDASNRKATGSAPEVSSGRGNGGEEAKFLEIGGFRMIEKSPGRVTVRFAVINHSDADMGEVSMRVNVRTTAAKPDDPPLLSFLVKTPSLGPNELREVKGEAPTKLRVYELPDWQFLKTDFRIEQKR